MSRPQGAWQRFDRQMDGGDGLREAEADDRTTTFDVSPSPFEGILTAKDVGFRDPLFSISSHAYVYARSTYLTSALGRVSTHSRARSDESAPG